ncbi:MAG: hypothetical protein AAF193_03040 [Bacteroidota bacterium]
MKTILSLLAIFFCCLISRSGIAQTTWLGTVELEIFVGITSYEWDNPANWDNGLPAPGNDAVIPVTDETVHIYNTVALPIDFNLINHADVLFSGGIILQEGTVDNHGAMEFGSTDNSQILGGTFNNYGFARANNGFFMGSTFFNYGEFYREQGGNTTVGVSATLHNIGVFYNYSNVINNGIINQCGTWTSNLPNNNPFSYGCPGCTNPIACNYDDIAIGDDGSCILPNGCTDSSACNYDSNATCDDGSCEFSSCADCCGIPFGDGSTCDGICGACNDDTSCYGCTYGAATNYDETKTIDDGSCEFPDVQQIYDNAFAAGAASVECPDNQSACPGDFNEDGGVEAADLLVFLGAFGTICVPQ